MYDMMIPLTPSFLFHIFSPFSTHNIPGFKKSSSCIFLVEGSVKKYPDKTLSVL